MKLSTLLMIANWLPAPVADQTCLAATLYLEARDQPVLGQLAVAEVAFRRLEQGNDGKTLCQVLTRPKQFALTLVSPRHEFNDAGAWARAYRVAQSARTLHRVPAQYRVDLVPGASHFYAWQRVSPNWRGKREVATIGDHRFVALD
ncbi:MAG: cell wall hydrolase [Ahniella sp.]|nr:cell wall hydrolase [Ahniella sp.]